MRWERLFADLETQLAAEFHATSEGELTERIRYETGQRALVDRIRAAVGSVVVIGLAPSGTLRGQLREAGPDWLLLADSSVMDEGMADVMADGMLPRLAEADWPDSDPAAEFRAGGETLVALAALQWVEGLPRQLLTSAGGRAWAGLDLRRALRVLVRERATVSVQLRDGQPLTGTLDGVFADHVELALHPRGEPRRSGAVTGTRSIPVAALAAIRRLD